MAWGMSQSLSSCGWRSRRGSDTVQTETGTSKYSAVDQPSFLKPRQNLPLAAAGMLRALDK